MTNQRNIPELIYKLEQMQNAANVHSIATAIARIYMYQKHWPKFLDEILEVLDAYTKGATWKETYLAMKEVTKHRKEEIK